MRTITADLLAGTSNTEAGLYDLNAHGASLLDGLRRLYASVTGQGELTHLPAYLVADAFGEQASRRIKNHVRDGFGRPIY